MKKKYELPVTEIIEMDTADFVAISTTVSTESATGPGMSREFDLELDFEEAGE